MEYIDILDEKGNKTDVVKEYEEVHKKGLWHEGVHVWLINSKKEILLQYRSKNKRNYPSMWDISAAGHVSSGENPATSAIRETKEEIGVDISVEELKKIGRIVQQGVFNNGIYIDNEYDNIYLVVKNLDINEFKISADEVQKLKWVPIPLFKQWVQEKKPDIVPHLEYVILFEALNYL